MITVSGSGVSTEAMASNRPFWALVARYPRAERARGFLEGVEQATHAGDSPAPGSVD